MIFFLFLNENMFLIGNTKDIGIFQKKKRKQKTALSVAMPLSVPQGSWRADNGPL